MNTSTKTALAAALLGAMSATAQAKGILEVPFDKANVSGIGAISGWHCTAQVIELVVDDGPPLQAATGTSRPDTMDACNNDGLNGFSLTVGWGIWGEGLHVMEAYADGELFDHSHFFASNEVDYIRDRASQVVVRGFPDPGESHVLKWNTATQNWQIEQTVSDEMDEPDWVKLEGTYQLDAAIVDIWGVGQFDSRRNINTETSGWLTISNRGKFRQTVTVGNSHSTVEGTMVDRGEFLEVIIDGERSFSSLISRGQVLSFMVFGDDFSEVDRWTRFQPSRTRNVTVRRSDAQQSKAAQSRFVSGQKATTAYTLGVRSAL